MTASAGSAGFGTTLGYGTAGGGVYTTMIAEITKITGPGGECDVIDISNMSSPAGFKEFIAGLVDAGEVSVDVIYTNAEAAALYALFRLTKGFQITLPDTHTWVFTGFIKSFGQEIPFDDKITNTVSFKITGQPTFT